MTPGTGRPLKPIDWDILDKLLESGCSSVEAAAHFNMIDDTLCRKIKEKYGMSFTDYSGEKASKGNGCLKLQQYMKAIGETDKGDNTMLVWLGKNRLEQKETPTTITVDKETVQSFKLAMEQISNAQEARKMEYTNLRNACKSDSVENETLT